jgi:hypothetical protein
MLPAVSILFLLVAAAGAVLAYLEVRSHPVPLPVGAMHGVAALLAIVLLVMHDVDSPGNHYVNTATVLFILAALGGLLLFGFRAARQKLPLMVIVLHAGFGLFALGLLFLGMAGA